ncbi:MAG: hypothetical protein V1885_02130 [Candidatus Brennerbacteria bacterium]
MPLPRPRRTLVGFPRRDTRAAHLVKQLALGAGIVTLSIIAPQSGAILVRKLLQQYFRRKSFERQRFLHDLKNLQARELIEWKEMGGGNVKITLTARGRKKALLYNLETIRLTRPKRWDGRWRLVMFDIPHRHKTARDALRHKLRELEFYPVQKSVFISPYPCEDELDFIATAFEVRQHVLLLSVDSFEGEEKLKHHFKLD